MTTITPTEEEPVASAEGSGHTAQRTSMGQDGVCGASQGTEKGARGPP
jgi:hypothetical protein